MKPLSFSCHTPHSLRPTVHNEHLINLAVSNDTHRIALLPMLHPTLNENAESHWHESVRSLCIHVLTLFKDADPDYFEQVASN